MSNFFNGIFVDNLGNISCRKGDSGFITITGLPTNENYNLIFAVSVPQTGEIVEQLSANTSASDSVRLDIPVWFTDKIGVGRFFYGIKLKSEAGEEMTVIPNYTMSSVGEITIENAPVFLVKRKLVEGEENGN